MEVNKPSPTYLKNTLKAYFWQHVLFYTTTLMKLFDLF